MEQARPGRDRRPRDSTITRSRCGSLNRNRAMNRYTSLAALLGAAALASCEKNAVQDITGTDPGARIRFFNFGVNAPGVNFYANDTKMTAISSTTGVESTTGTAYGGVGFGGLYSGIAPGRTRSREGSRRRWTRTLRSRSVTATLEDGKHYSFYHERLLQHHDQDGRGLRRGRSVSGSDRLLRRSCSIRQRDLQRESDDVVRAGFDHQGGGCRRGRGCLQVGWRVHRAAERIV